MALGILCGFAEDVQLEYELSQVMEGNRLFLIGRVEGSAKGGGGRAGGADAFFQAYQYGLRGCCCICVLAFLAAYAIA